ncbi:Hypothetical_protein [Hexamita inflata]|uniref:Hypothetical_protein n=1 Tax=Hexamita inflata TaxID=28002 RepID=A0AA86P9F3_9EUKA|nr:Hypothetical protein HINF_LOCUS1938 [Hexamita inflata]CAI9934679.1 Hypothetical protein HINF_LOCUS22324 [Hexamita inflata]CAI9939059.1 Hypothetical protein HINF_LOCUS26704 [Hexamita inflata]
MKRAPTYTSLLKPHQLKKNVQFMYNINIYQSLAKPNCSQTLTQLNSSLNNGSLSISDTEQCSDQQEEIINVEIIINHAGVIDNLKVCRQGNINELFRAYDQ